MPTNKMIERVAKAIKDVAIDPDTNWSRQWAIAAISAMREPTDEMMVAAEIKVEGLLSFNDKEMSPSYEAWQAMIDAVLKDV